LRLNDHLRKLFTIILEDYPNHYEEILKLAGEKKARIIDGHEVIVISFKNKKMRITKDIPQIRIPTGLYSKESIIELMDGQVSLNEAIKLGFVDCKAKLSEILRFWEILQIVIYVSSRSVRAYELWSEYKRAQ
jgi:hypothetical protein